MGLSGSSKLNWLSVLTPVNNWYQFDSTWNNRKTVSVGELTFLNSQSCMKITCFILPWDYRGFKTTIGKKKTKNNLQHLDTRCLLCRFCLFLDIITDSTDSLLFLVYLIPTEWKQKYIAVLCENDRYNQRDIYSLWKLWMLANVNPFCENWNWIPGKVSGFFGHLILARYK